MRASYVLCGYAVMLRFVSRHAPMRDGDADGQWASRFSRSTLGIAPARAGDTEVTDDIVVNTIKL